MLASSLEEEGAVFRAQLRAKEQEVGVLQGGLAKQREEYEVGEDFSGFFYKLHSPQDILEEKRALETEIAVYKRLIDAMDKRLR